MKLLLNILWFIFGGGFVSGTLWLLAGCLLTVTVIGLPWAPSAFRLAGFSYFPFGKEVAHPPSMEQPGSMLLNVIWIVFAGWWLALHHVALAFVLACTIIGIPFAWQHLKLAILSLAPVGTMVLDR